MENIVNIVIRIGLNQQHETTTRSDEERGQHEQPGRAVLIQPGGEVDDDSPMIDGEVTNISDRTLSTLTDPQYLQQPDDTSDRSHRMSSSPNSNNTKIWQFLLFKTAVVSSMIITAFIVFRNEQPSATKEYIASKLHQLDDTLDRNVLLGLNTPTPQSQAIDWMVNQTFIENIDSASLLEHFAALTFCFASGNIDYALSGESDLCKWNDNKGTGIFCADNVRPIQVTSIVLPEVYGERMLQQPNFNKKYRDILPTELGYLSQLQSFSLSTPYYKEFLGDCLSEANDVSDHCFGGGMVPSELGRITTLKSITFQNLNLHGDIPSELDHLSNLEHLNLAQNKLSGAIAAELGQLFSLKIINFEGNKLNGTIPVIFGLLSNLEHLNLSTNNLSGTIPTELGLLSALISLSLGHNSLSGSIPTEVRQLSNLEHIDNAGNKFPNHTNRTENNDPPSYSDPPWLNLANPLVLGRCRGCPDTSMSNDEDVKATETNLP